jgi:predicted cobalt transporter CbtA
MKKLVEFFVRFRTWIVNLTASVLIVLPELLDAPEVLAVIPQQYQKYVFVAALILNIMMRPRPAVMAKDPEVTIAKAIAGNDAEHA